MKTRFYSTLFLSVCSIILTAFIRYDQVDIDLIRKRFWTLKTHQSKLYNIVVYGDSRVYRGVDPATLTKINRGLSAINFGYSSASYSSFMLDEIEKRLNKIATTRILIFGITPNSLSLGAKKDLHYREELNRKKEEIIENLYLENIKGKFSPFKINLMQTDGRSKLKYEYIEEYHDNGWVASNQIPEDTTRAFETYLNNFKVNKISNGLVDTLLIRVKKWKSDNVRIIGFRPPTSHSMEKIELNSGFDEKDFISRFRKAGGYWIDLPKSHYETYDGSHLKDKSAIKCTEYIARKIKLLLN